MRSDQELKEAYRVSVNGAGTISLVSLDVFPEPESNTRVAELIGQDVAALLDEDPHREYDVIVQLLPLLPPGRPAPFGRRAYALHRTRKIHARISCHGQARRFAIVGGGLLVRTMANVIARAADRGKRTRWFADREEAAEWLREGVESD